MVLAKTLLLCSSIAALTVVITLVLMMQSY